MLADYPLNTVLATRDLAGAKAWYADKLGWEPAGEAEGRLYYEIAGAELTIYETPNAGSAKNTVAIWRVADLPATMARLRARGVTFEDYDFGEYKTVDGVMSDPDYGSSNAWFADVDENIWSLFVNPSEPRPESIGPMLAASDLARAKRWYADALGYEPEREFEGQVIVYASGGQGFSVYATQYAGTAKNTVAGWNVADIESEMAALRARGVVFEEYDFGPIKTVNGLMTDPAGEQAAWFKDSEGNILGLAHEARPG